MLTGELVTLRPIERDDVPLLHAWDQDHDTWPESSANPYAPTSLADTFVAYDAKDPSHFRADDKNLPLAVTVGDALVGSVCLWGIDTFNRRAHLGISLGPDHRGKGYGTDACRVIVRHAFVDRGLHRVQLEVLASNTAGLRAYEKAGFVRDGVLRQSAWVRGALVDEVVMSVLATD
ncbi:MAG: GNAT family protein [Mycobacteriales bacterium]